MSTTKAAVVVSWKTSLAGLCLGLPLICKGVLPLLDSDPNTTEDMALIGAGIAAILAGIFSRDSNVSSRRAGAAVFFLAAGLVLALYSAAPPLVVGAAFAAGAVLMGLLAPLGLLAAAAALLAVLLGAGCHPLDRELVTAARGFERAVAPEYLAYVDADADLTEPERVDRHEHVEAFREALDAAEDRLDPTR